MIKQKRQHNLENEPEKIPYIKSNGTDDADTADERTKIFIGLEGKKQDSRLHEIQNDQDADSEESQVKMFTKLPSYFLDVKQNSVILEQQFQYSVKDSNENHPKQPKYQKHHQKILKKISNTTSNNIKCQFGKTSQLAYSSLIYIIHNQLLQQNQGYIWDRFVCFGKLKICVNQITKLKCLLDFVSPKERKLKIVQNQNHVVFFAASTTLSGSSLEAFSQHYLWFSKLINKKLQSIKHLLKPIQDNQPPQLLPPNLNPQKPLISGIIYKKSQLLQNWQPRYIIITQTQLLSYKNITKQPTFSIRSQSCKYIWTRFDLHNGYLIIKLKHGLVKTQFAIPIVNFCQGGRFNWLAAFYRMLVFDKGY